MRGWKQPKSELAAGYGGEICILSTSLFGDMLSLHSHKPELGPLSLAGVCIMHRVLHILGAVDHSPMLKDSGC